MINDFVSSAWFRFILPVILLASIGYGLDPLIERIEENLLLAQRLPYLLLGVSILIAHLFRQSRLAMLACALLVSYWLTQQHWIALSEHHPASLPLILLAMLFPVACLITYAFQNQGVLTKGFTRYLILLSLLLVWGSLTSLHFDQQHAQLIDQGILFSVPQISLLPLIVVLYLCVLTGISAILLLSSNRLNDSAVYNCLLLVSIGLIYFHIPFINIIVFSLAAIFLLLTLLSAGHTLAFHDRLTQIPARHALELDLQRLGKVFTVAMIDVDHFKSFNDQYGHSTGDEVLKLVASRLALIPTKVWYYRYGGEEFTLLFKGKTAKQVQDALEWLRDDIEHLSLIISDTQSIPLTSPTIRSVRKTQSKRSPTITISIGVCDSQTESNPKLAIPLADQALYKAKKSGRNCIKIAS